MALRKSVVALEGSPRSAVDPGSCAAEAVVAARDVRATTSAAAALGSACGGIANTVNDATLIAAVQNVCARHGVDPPAFPNNIANIDHIFDYLHRQHALRGWFDGDATLTSKTVRLGDGGVVDGEVISVRCNFRFVYGEQAGHVITKQAEGKSKVAAERNAKAGILLEIDRLESRSPHSLDEDCHEVVREWLSPHLDPRQSVSDILTSIRTGMPLRARGDIEPKWPARSFRPKSHVGKRAGWARNLVHAVVAMLNARQGRGLLLLGIDIHDTAKLWNINDWEASLEDVRNATYPIFDDCYPPLREGREYTFCELTSPPQRRVIAACVTRPSNAGFLFKAYSGEVPYRYGPVILTLCGREVQGCEGAAGQHFHDGWDRLWNASPHVIAKMSDAESDLAGAFSKLCPPDIRSMFHHDVGIIEQAFNVMHQKHVLPGWFHGETEVISQRANREAGVTTGESITVQCNFAVAYGPHAGSVMTEQADGGSKAEAERRAKARILVSIANLDSHAPSSSEMVCRRMVQEYVCPHLSVPHTPQAVLDGIRARAPLPIAVESTALDCKDWFKPHLGTDGKQGWAKLLTDFVVAMLNSQHGRGALLLGIADGTWAIGNCRSLQELRDSTYPIFDDCNPPLKEGREFGFYELSPEPHRVVLVCASRSLHARFLFKTSSNHVVYRDGPAKRQLSGRVVMEAEDARHHHARFVEGWAQFWAHARH